MTVVRLLAGFLALVSSGCATSSDTAADATAARSSDGSIHVTSEALATRSRVDEPLDIRLVARNDGTDPLRFLVWNTPFDEALSADIFEITFEGDILDYRGIMFRRALPPDEDAYVTLGAGETLDAVVDLAQSYALDRPGQYTIRFQPQPPLAIDDTGDAGAALVAVSDPFTIERH